MPDGERDSGHVAGPADLRGLASRMEDRVSAAMTRRMPPEQPCLRCAVVDDAGRDPWCQWIIRHRHGGDDAYTLNTRSEPLQARGVGSRWPDVCGVSPFGCGSRLVIGCKSLRGRSARLLRDGVVTGVTGSLFDGAVVDGGRVHCCALDGFAHGRRRKSSIGASRRQYEAHL